MLNDFFFLDFSALLAVLLSCLSCALLGTYLLLRNMSMLGDAVSHAVLPGIVIGFIASHGESNYAVLFGALIAGLIAVFLIEFLRSYMRFDVGTAMGVIFSLFFALGILFIELLAGPNAHIDADCLLSGQLETILWYLPAGADSYLAFDSIIELPAELWLALLVAVCVSSFCAVFQRGLKASSFDPDFCDSIGMPSRRFHFLLTSLVALAVVASFKIFGAILVIALLVCPAATVRLLTDRFSLQLILSVLVALVGGLAGYLIAAQLPMVFGYDYAWNAAGTISTTLGLILLASIICAPRYGALAKFLRLRLRQQQVELEDLLGLLLDLGDQEILSLENRFKRWRLIRYGVTSGLLEIGDAGALSLSPEGRARAEAIAHRKVAWQTVLESELGVDSHHTRHTTHMLEHLKLGPEDIVEKQSDKNRGEPE